MKIGTNEISKIYLGNTEISKAYLGGIEVYNGGGSGGGGGIDEHTILMLHLDDNTSNSSNYTFDYATGSTLSLTYQNGKFNKALQLMTSTGPCYFQYYNIDQQFTINDEFTIDYWQYFSTSSLDYSYVQASNSAGYRWSFKMLTGGYAQLFNGSSIQTSLSGVDSVINNNEWNHVAIIVKKGQYTKLFLNGNLFYEGTLPDYYLNTGIRSISIYGSASNASDHCYLDEIRFSNIARWTENFTPPTQPYS